MFSVMQNLYSGVVVYDLNLPIIVSELPKFSVNRMNEVFLIENYNDDVFKEVRALGLGDTKLKRGICFTATTEMLG